ncbi:hypothetical protein CDAR_447661 [Caerostris darwini]|uniref:Uncharacterized protein n=1 Tax=Caerostris darwini TaxID=1538125 RepID=A0AAV4PSE1_9ARAC|nr:hypothetical protein CDAR_447661 [Caerostris darwini]
MDRERSFEDLRLFVHLMAFFMDVKIIMDYFEVGIFGGVFGVAVMFMIGIGINKVLNYNWKNFLAILKRMMLKLWSLTKIFIEIVIFTVIECLFLALYASGFFGIIAIVVIAVELYRYDQQKI